MTDERPVAEIPPLPKKLSPGQSGDSSRQPDEQASPDSVPVTSENQADSLSTVDMALMTSIRQGQAKLYEELHQFVQKLDEYLGKVLNDVTSLEVKTYATSDMKTVKFENNGFTGEAELRAVTRINLNGNVFICVPDEHWEANTAIWDVHMEMVRQAQQSHVALMQTIVQAATGIASLLDHK